MTLTPIVSVQPPNFSVGETFSYVQVDNNQDRAMYAKVVYPVNIAEQLTTITTLLCAILAK